MTTNISNNLLPFASNIPGVKTTIFEEPWPEPDMGILSGYQLTPPKFPIEVFDKEIAEWLTKEAELKGCSIDPIACFLLASCAGLIGNAVLVSRGGKWKAPIALWMAIVAGVGSGKSPALDSILSPIDNIESTLSPEFDVAWKKYEEDKADHKRAYNAWEKDRKEAFENKTPLPPIPNEATEPKKPPRIRLLVKDTTTEALIDICVDNPRGLMVVRDELAGIMEGMNRYSSGNADRTFYLEAFEGKSFTQDRVKNDGKPKRIEKLALSMLGGIQPARLHEAILKGVDDGLSGRFLYCFPEPMEPILTEDCDENDDFLIDLFTRLREIPLILNQGIPEPKVMKLNGDARLEHHKFNVELYKRAKASNGLLKSHLSKLAGIVLRLAGILEILSWAISNSMDDIANNVSLTTLQNACKLVSEYFIPMAERAFGSASLPEQDENAQALATWLFNNPTDLVNASEVRKKRVAGLKTEDAVTQAIDGLIEAGWLKPKFNREGSNPGRQKKDYMTNPKIWEVKE